MIQEKKIKEYKNLNKLPLTDGQKRLVIAKSNKLVKLRKKVSIEKKAIHIVWDNIYDTGSISLANIDEIHELLENYRQSLEILQELKDEIYSVRNEIKSIVLEAKREEKYRQRLNDNLAKEHAEKEAAPKMIKFVFTVQEASALQKHLEQFLRDKPDAKKVTIELASDHVK